MKRKVFTVSYGRGSKQTCNGVRELGAFIAYLVSTDSYDNTFTVEQVIQPLKRHKV